jgi:predicted DCC family thiol-disulfide oxidoreductase YuxK
VATVEAYSYRSDPAVGPFPDDRPLMIYDGFCGLCSRAVQFVLRHDKRGQFRFLPAQSELGTALYRHYGLDAESYETFIVLANGIPSFASDAALDLLPWLGPPWSLGRIGRLVPRGLRDQFYFWIARNRMRFFGRSEACHLPAPEHRDRFLTGEITAAA